MSTSPNNSPKAKGSDALSERPIAERPKQVLYAVALLCLSILLEIPSAIDEYPATAAGGISALYLGYKLAMYAVAICVIIYLARGNNWSRYVLLVLTGLGLVGVAEQYQKYSALQFALLAADLVINVVAVWLVFTRPGALWFIRARGADGTTPANPRRHALGAAFWIVLTLAIIVINPMIMGVPGILLFVIGDALAKAILGTNILAHFPEDQVFDISTPMSIAWPVGGFVLWVLFASHKPDRAWRIKKWGLFLVALVAWDVGLSVYFHLGATPSAESVRNEQFREDFANAAKGGDLATVKALVAGGANVNQRTFCKDSPLIAATRAGQAQVVEFLLQAGARIDFRGDCQMKESMLCMAAAGGSLEVVRMLQQRGAPVNDSESDGRTPLMCASAVGNLEVMKFLLENGADVHAIGTSSNYPPPKDTALMVAAMNGRSQATQLLLEHGAVVNQKGTNGSTALALAAGGRDQGQYLSGFSVTARDYPGTVRILLEHGAEPNAVFSGQQGGTPLLLALRNLGREGNKAAKVLLEGGANPNIPGPGGETPLMIAVKKRNAEAVQLLLAKGADPSAMNEQGRTAAQSARMLAFPEIEQLLPAGDTTRGASVGATTTASATAPAPPPRIAKTLWKVTLGARPLSGGPWFADGIVVFHTMTRTEPPRGRLLALAAQTGARVWETKTDAPLISSPALAGGIMYFGDGNPGLLSSVGRVLAVTLATGKIVWEFPTSSAESSEPLVRDRSVYVRSGRDWYAIDRGTGKELWHVRADGSSAYPPVLSGSTILLGEAGGHLVALDAQSGRTKWKFAPSGKETLASPASAFGDKIFFRVRTGENAGLIYAVELETGRVVMRVPTGSGMGSAPVADDKAVYFMDMRNLTAVAFPGGERLWSLDLQNANAGYDTPLVSAGNYLYAVPLRLLKIDRTTGTIEWRMFLTGVSGRGGTVRNLRDGQICAPFDEQIGRKNDLVHKVNLAAGNIAWTVRLTDFTTIQTITCEDRMLFYFDDWGDYPAYGVELLEPEPNTK